MRKSLSIFLVAASVASLAAHAESATITLTEPDAPVLSVAGTADGFSFFANDSQQPTSWANGSAGDDPLNPVVTVSTFDEFGGATPYVISIPSLCAAVSITPDENTSLGSAQVTDNFSFTIDSATPYVFLGTQTITGSAADISGSGFGLFEGTDASGTAIAVPDPSLGGAFSFSGTLAPGSYFLSAQIDLQDGTFNGVNGGSFQGSATFAIPSPEPSTLILCALGAVGLFLAARRSRA